MEDKNNKLIMRNKKATFEFEIIEKLEAGIVLKGTEVKSLRLGKVSLKESYIVIEKQEVFILNMHIAPYDHGNIYNHNETRKRKLLLRKREIKRLDGKVKEKGLTIIPLSIYLKKGKVKLSIALARGKKIHDKRQDIKQRDVKRELGRALKNKSYV